MDSRSPFKATKLWNQLINSFVEGMELKRRRFRFKSYENCFSGSDALEWMFRYLQGHPSYGDNVTKEQAFMLLQKFMENRVFECVTEKTSSPKFQNSNCLYKFNKSQNGKDSDKITMTIPSQKSITNLLNNVQKDLGTHSTQSSLAETKAKTSALFEPSDEESLDTINSSQNFFSRSNSLRIRKPLSSLTHQSSQKHSLQNKRITRGAATISPQKRRSNDTAEVFEAKKRKVTSKLFRSVISKNSNKIENAQTCSELQQMEISPIKTTYKSSEIIQHFSPSPLRRTLRKTVSSDLNKFKSRSQHDLASSGDSYGLYKVNSSWDLNKLDSNSQNNFMLSKDRLSQTDMEETWKSVVLLSLRKILKMVHVSEYIDQYQISGKTIMENMRYTENQVKGTDWLVSAMECLMNWPNYNTNAVAGGLPSYTGFQCDVFQAIKQHYYSMSNEPLIPCHLTSLIEECMEYAENDRTVCTQGLQHTILLINFRKRCQLQLLIKFMQSVSENHLLRICTDLSNKDLMVHSFFRIISRKENQFLSTQTEVLGIRLAYYLIQHYNEIFKPPNGLGVQVDHKIAIIYGNLRHNKNDGVHSSSSLKSEKGRQMSTYCQQITKEEYQKEAVDFSHQEVRNLMQSIISDRSLSNKELSKILKQFKDTYPDIYDSIMKDYRLDSAS